MCMRVTSYLATNQPNGPSQYLEVRIVRRPVVGVVGGESFEITEVMLFFQSFGAEGERVCVFGGVLVKYVGMV